VIYHIFEEGSKGCQLNLKSQSIGICLEGSFIATSSFSEENYCIESLKTYFFSEGEYELSGSGELFIAMKND